MKILVPVPDGKYCLRRDNKGMLVGFICAMLKDLGYGGAQCRAFGQDLTGKITTYQNELDGWTATKTQAYTQWYKCSECIDAEMEDEENEKRETNNIQHVPDTGHT